MPLSRSLLPLLATVAAFTFAQAAGATTRAECEKLFQPQVGQAGKDVIWVPTPDELVDKMLSTAKVTPQDFVVDLGAGDGKIAIAAGKRFGATALGIEYNPDMVRLAQCMVQAEGVGSRVKMVQGDIFKEDFSKATVVTMYLLPDLNLCVRHRLLAMKPGTRVTSHAFTMGDWEPDAKFEAGYRNAFLWHVPARVGGTWNLRGRELDLELRLQQHFQKVGGEVVFNGRRQPLLGAALDGNALRFSYVDAQGQVQHFTGTVDGGTLQGDLRGDGSREIEGRLRDAPAAAPWAEMAPRCDRFYR